MITPVFAPMDCARAQGEKSALQVVSTGAHGLMRAWCDQGSGIGTGLRPWMWPRTGGVTSGQGVHRHRLHARIRRLEQSADRVDGLLAPRGEEIGRASC